LACTSDGAYLSGGGASGRIYFWEVASGRLLRVWPAHYKAVSCLVFSEDDSLLISGADDGLVNVWPLLRSPHLAVELIFMFFSLKHLDLSENVNNIQKA
jgi:WD40 repeat protein